MIIITANIIIKISHGNFFLEDIFSASICFKVLSILHSNAVQSQRYQYTFQIYQSKLSKILKENISL